MTDSSDWVEFGVESGPDSKSDRRVATVTIADMKEQERRDNELNRRAFHVLAMAGVQSREWEALQPALNEFNLRHSVKPKPIESQESRSTKENNGDDSGPHQILRITKGVGLDGFRQTLITELEDRLNSTRMNADPNAVASPQIFKKGYQSGLKECIALIKTPIYIEGSR